MHIRWCRCFLYSANDIKAHLIYNVLRLKLIFFDMLFFFCLFYQDNVFVISNLKSKYPVLQLDLRSAYNFFCCCSDCHFIYKWQKLLVDIFSSCYRLISDLVVVIVSATCGGIAFACAGQPVCPLSPPFALFILNFFGRLGFIFYLLFFQYWMRG